MNIQSIRLKNIKSYGVGPVGDGVTVHFQPGVNRIAGLNGSGKTTLIECLGYALFMVEPLKEENFKTETYLLSHGAGAGEIDVVFSHKGETYRLERGVGRQSKRRSKVVQVSDQSICAENDEAVAGFICRLFDLPSPNNLSEIFSKLIGVKQGRLAWPFDSKAGEAKRFFESLLQVEIFRDCWEKLKPVGDLFRVQQEQQRRAEASVNERIRERADSVAKLELARASATALTTTVQKTTEEREAALVEKNRQEALQKAVSEAASARDLAAAKTRNSEQLRAQAEKEHVESEQASAKATECKPAHEAYEAAEKQLTELERQRQTRDQLRRNRDQAANEQTSCSHKGTGARQQVDLLNGQKGQKLQQRSDLKQRIGGLRSDLDSTAASFQASQKAGSAAQIDRGTLREWVRGLPALLGEFNIVAGAIGLTQAELAAWESSKLESARKTEKVAADGLAEAKELLAQTRARKTALDVQLEQINGGLCPFLKETCRQFDPAKVQADVTQLDAEIHRLEQLESRSKKAHESAEKALKGLVAEETRLSERRRRLEKDLENYLNKYASVVPSSLVVCVRRLCAWHGKLEEVPNLVPLPETNSITAESLPLLQEQLRSFVADAENWWQEVSPELDKRLNAVEKARTDRAQQEANLKNFSDQCASVLQEITRLEKQAETQQTEANRLDAEAAKFKAMAEGFEKQLLAFAALDQQREEQEVIKTRNKPGHDACLAAQALAGKLEARRAHLQACKNDEASARTALVHATESLTQAQQNFDPAGLKAAQEEYVKKLTEATAATSNLKHAQTELSTQQTRFAEWQAACLALQQISLNIARCEAAMQLVALARKTLDKTAPAVAKHLCTRIARRAQAVFNQINPDPVELTWNSDNYSLRVTPNDRRFAMLSGGEQTELALAMTLAMVEEFSGLRFCIFDEPTYGVDAESRRKLADVVLEIQKAAGLEQLLLVSHDDAFEGRIEHTILLRKSATHGTTVELA